MVQSNLSSRQPAVPIKLPAVSEHFKQQPIVAGLEHCQEMGVFMRERESCPLNVPYPTRQIKLVSSEPQLLSGPHCEALSLLPGTEAHFLSHQLRKCLQIELENPCKS